MSKTRDTGFLGNVIKVDTSGNVSFVSGSTTLATINTSGQLSGSSPVLSSSYALNADLLDGLDSTQFTLTSSFAAQTASFTAFTSSILSYTASQNILNGTYATTGSNTFKNPQTINSNLIVTGSITAATLVVQTITSSVVYSSGSNVFGNNIANTQVMTGSVTVTGSFRFGSSNQQTAGSERIYVGQNSAVGIDDANSLSLSVAHAPATGSPTISFTYQFRTNDNTGGNLYGDAIKVVKNAGASSTYTVFTTNSTIGAGTERMRIDSTGSIGIGTSSPGALLHIYDSTAGSTKTYTKYSALEGGDIRVGKDSGVNNNAMFGAWSNNATVFYTNSTERMRITEGGNVFIGCTGSPNSSVNGIGLFAAGQIGISRSGDLVAFFNRNTNDGTIIDLRQDNNIEGTISVSGATVSYNSFLGSHWSQLQDGSKIEILKGTILETIDEMCVWEDEINDRLPKSKISDTIESKNVYGIFLDWDNDWQTSNDFYVAAVGLGYIRINANQTIQIGDLLQSNGDGTAKVQSDDIMRSSTIAKVVLTNKIKTYEDGSYLVAATLHCG